MRKAHHGFSVLTLLLSFISLLLSGLTAYVSAQEPGPSPETVGEIELYRQGLAFHGQGLIVEARARFQRVIELSPDSADAHAKLAYALILADQTQNALAMAQRALELGDQGPEAHYVIAEANLRMRADPLKSGQLPLAVEEADTALRIKPDFAPALITKSFALFHLKRYFEAATCLEAFVGINPDDVEADTWRGQLEQMREQPANSSATIPIADPTVFAGAMLTQRARVISKPEPQYTEAARKAGVVGTVVLRAVFASDGKIKQVFVLQGLGYGLTTASVKAARQIKFQPALKDGTPVSMYMQLEYNFNLY